jgi:hypothetical protein
MFESLTVNWPYLLVSLVLLWAPRFWLRTGKRVLKRRRKPDGALEQLAGVGARNPEDRSVHPGKEFATFRNYIDLFRALVGSYGLHEYGLVATTPSGELTEFLLVAVALLIGVLIQSIRFADRLSFFAAIFYLLGLSTGSMEHYASLFAFALVLAINPILANARMFISAHGVLLAVFGVVFSADRKMLAVNVFLFLLIPLLSLLSKRPVVIFSRKSKSGAK